MGLNTSDLKFLVDEVFEIDSFQSKMGEDKDIVTLSFSVREREAAKDLMNFCEKGYPFVLDADVSTGEQSDGTYKVFIEIERSPEIPTQIEEMIYGISKLAEIEKPRFRYYKAFKSLDATTENLNSTIPLTDETYEKTIQENAYNNYSNFFTKSMVESIFMNAADEIIVSKAYAQPLKLKAVKFGSTLDTIEQISETINMKDMSEVLFLTKYLGDYNITKYGHNTLSLENKGHTLVVQR
jgi:hypothetical protein